LSGNPLEAAVLGRAALAGEDTPATRLVIGQALETLEPLIRRFDGLAEEVVATGFMPTVRMCSRRRGTARFACGTSRRAS